MDRRPRLSGKPLGRLDMRIILAILLCFIFSQVNASQSSAPPLTIQQAAALSDVVVAGVVEGSHTEARRVADSSARDWMIFDIRVTALWKGTVEECAALVVFLSSERASYITGQTYLVNGGAHFL